MQTVISTPVTSRSAVGAVAPGGRRGRQAGRTLWFVALAAAVCFEGLGRKLLPGVPATVFYFSKDAVLIAGIVAFGIKRPVLGSARALFRGFMPLLVAAAVFTLLQAANPGQERVEFGLLGLRAYWLWWSAPLVVATALDEEKTRSAAVLVFGAFAALIAVFAMFQFSLPMSHPLNAYAPSPADMHIAAVSTTGRPRVTSTFSYITGFTDFCIIVPALLLSIGLSSRSRFHRLALLGATVLAAVALPMAGSRGPVVLGLAGLAIVSYAAGLLSTREGRRVVAGGALAIAITLAFSRDAVQGVADRFSADAGETRGRFLDGIQYVPPFAIAYTEYPVLGLGTGTLQNAAVVHGATQEYLVEHEPGRILVELGVLGYLLVSAVRVGLVVALWRAGRSLKRAGRRAEAGFAFALAAFTLPGNLFFDHVFQALYFIGVGLVLQAVVRARAARSRSPLVSGPRACVPSS